MDGLLAPDDMMFYGSDAPVDPTMAMAVPEMGLLMLPASGVAEALGYAPDPFSDEYLPSTMELMKRGDIEGLGYQALGLGGDVLYAASPLFPFLAPMATAAKTARLANVSRPAAKISDAEIMEMVEQSKNSPFFRDKTATNLQPKAQKLLERDPFMFGDALSNRAMSDLMPRMDMTRNPILRRHQPTSIEDLQGQAIAYAQGDITRGGGLLTGLNDFNFETPVKMQAGKNYGLLVPDDDFGWASGRGVTTDYANQLAGARKDFGEDTPVNLMFVTMASKGGDFALHTSETFAELVKGAKIAKPMQEKINKQIREKIDPKFVGIKSKKLRSYLRNIGGSKRAALLKELDKQTFYDGGLPNIGEVRSIVAEPELLGTPSFTAGPSFFRMDPSRPMTYRPDLHNSYPYSVPREGPMRMLDQNVPAPLLFPEAYADVAKVDRSGNPTGVSMRQYGMDMKKPYQLVTQEVVDNVMRYNELLGR